MSYFVMVHVPVNRKRNGGSSTQLLLSKTAFSLRKLCTTKCDLGIAPRWSGDVDRDYWSGRIVVYGTHVAKRRVTLFMSCTLTYSNVVHFSIPNTKE